MSAIAAQFLGITGYTLKVGTEGPAAGILKDQMRSMASTARFVV